MIPNREADPRAGDERAERLLTFPIREIQPNPHYLNIFEERGLSLLKKQRGGSHLTLDRRFRSAFGISSHLCCTLWQKLKNEDIKKMTPDHLLWGLFLLKSYSFETTNSAFAGVDEKTFRKWSLFAIEQIADLHSQVVSLCLA